MNPEPFDERKLKHSTSPLALSDWQELQDPSGNFATAMESDYADPDDDLGELDLSKACTLDNPECESCS